VDGPPKLVCRVPAQENLDMDRKADIARRLEETRARTLWMLGQVPDEYLRVRVHSFYSPIGWHFGHVGRTEEYWVCQALGMDPCDPQLSFLYADLPDNPKDNRVHIPDRPGSISYLNRTREIALRALELTDLETDDPLVADGYAWEFAIQHECQHQETISEMLQLIQRQRKQPEIEPANLMSSMKDEYIQVAGGEFVMGHADRHGYDNEKGPHQVKVDPFRLAKRQVTASQWFKFMLDGGYSRDELWTPEGWLWRRDENVSAPECWLQTGGGWACCGPFGIRAIDADEPAACISHYEAEAYANWSGRRLPTEEEWEFAASSAGGSGNTSRRYPWGENPATDEHACHALKGWKSSSVGSHRAGDTPLGLQDMAGNIWEWTSSKFLPYPGFVAFPYDGYSKDHMKGKHYVCRGGSWATSPGILRCSFRNWYVPSYRQGFLGLRLAED